MDEYFNDLFKDVDANIKLDKEQIEVILDESKKLMVVAGAGSGKTTTMTAKVKYLVEIKKIDPQKIVLISFTNKAVEELRERINDQFRIPCYISTFHSLAFSILKDSGLNYKVLSNPQEIVENFFKIHKKESKNLKNVRYSTEILSLYKINPVVFHHKNKFSESFKHLYNYYLDYMNNNKLIDFEDMINKAYDLVKQNKVSIKYQYIIIDEFQDISFNRYQLILEIARMSDCNIIVVGDDWQAIFSFAGSDINLFHDFSKDAKVLKIANTYRNSQELINIAGKFVMKNKNQIVKYLKSNKHNSKPLEIIGYFNQIKSLMKILNHLVIEYGIDQKILLIGRYQFDINNYIDNENFNILNNKIIYKKYPKLDITFLTAHASKGLGYDNVVILNMNKGVYGFPSLIKNDEIKTELLNNNEKFIHAEERRLFYVALTRTKNKVYLLYKFGKKSPFLKELLK